MNKSELTAKITPIEPFAILDEYDWDWLLEHMAIISLTQSKPYYLPNEMVYWLPVKGIMFLQEEDLHRSNYGNIRLKVGMLWCTKSQHCTKKLQTIYPLTDGLIGMLAETSLTMLLQRSQNLRWLFVQSQFFALTSIEKELHQIKMVSLTNRCINLLLELNQWYGNDEHRFPYTQRELAQVLNTYREAINRVIQPLKKQGWIHTYYEAIQLTNIPMLRRITQGKMVIGQ